MVLNLQDSSMDINIISIKKHFNYFLRWTICENKLQDCYKESYAKRRNVCMSNDKTEKEDHDGLTLVKVNLGQCWTWKIMPIVKVSIM